MNIKIGANVKGAVAGLKKVGLESRKTGKGMQMLALKAGALFAAYKLLNVGGRALVGTFKKAGTELAVMGDRLAKQARMVGVTAQQYQNFEFAAKRSGTSVTHVANGLKKLGRVMLDAQNGSRQIKDTFAALDIELKKSDGTLRDVNDVFLEMADRVRDLGPSAERTGAMMLLLGRSGTELTNMMAGGAESIKVMQHRLEQLGAVMSKDLLRASEDFVDAQADMEHAVRGLQIRVGEELIPELTAATTAWTNFIAALDEREVAAVATWVLDLATGAALAADAFFDLGLARAFAGDPKRVKAQEQINDLESINKALRDGVNPIYALGKGYEDIRGAVSEAMDAFEPAKPQNLAKTLIKTALGVKTVTIGTQQMAKATSLQVREYEKMAKAMGGDNAVAQLQKRGLATEAEAKAARALGMARTELSKIEAEQLALFAKTREMQAAKGEADKARGEAHKKRLAEIDERRKAAAALLKSLKDGARTQADADKEMAKSLDRRTRMRLERLSQFLEGERELDQRSLQEMFLNRELTEEEFRARSRQSEIEATRAIELEKLEIYKWARHENFIDAAGEAARISALDQSLQQQRRDAAKETSRIILEQQLEDIAAITKMVDAVGGMFSSLSGLAMQAYEEGDADAKKHAVAMFNIAQALALSTAIVNTATGVAGALGNPGLVAAFPANIIAATTIGAAGAAEIATIIGTSIQGIGDAGITSEMLKRAGLNNHSAIAMRNDETLLDPVGTKHITEMLAIQKAQMQNGGGEQTIRTTVELDGRVLGESVDNYLIRQQERGVPYGNRVRQEYV